MNRKHLHQIQGNWGGRNFSNCLLREFTARYAWKTIQMNLKSKTTNIFNSWIINSLQCDYSINEFWFFFSTKRTSIKFRILRVVSREVRSLKSHSQILLVRLQKKNKNLEILSFFLEVDLIGQNHSIVIRGDWLWKAATVLKFMLEAPWKCTTFVFCWQIVME